MTRVSALWRHPIKGHGREALDCVELTAGQTMPWDRRWAVAHKASKADGSTWAPSINFSRGSKLPSLMAINARTNEDTGTVTLSHPALPDLTFDPDHEVDVFLDWVRPIMPADKMPSTQIHRVADRGMTDTDYPSISLINLASHTQVSKKLGQSISPLRWRCNIHLEGFEPWEENSWIGKSLRLGAAELAIHEPILRCMATTANPETGMRDADTLGTLKANWNHQNFGVYAQVIRSGKIIVGDQVEVLK